MAVFTLETDYPLDNSRQTDNTSQFDHLLKRLCHENIVAVLGQFCVKVITKSLNSCKNWPIIWGIEIMWREVLPF